jgi:hypothetical protein
MIILSLYFNSKPLDAGSGCVPQTSLGWAVLDSLTHHCIHRWTASPTTASTAALLAGWMEDILMGFAIDYLKERQAHDEPFFMYYPAFSVHA